MENLQVVLIAVSVTVNVVLGIRAIHATKLADVVTSLRVLIGDQNTRISLLEQEQEQVRDWIKAADKKLDRILLNGGVK